MMQKTFFLCAAAGLSLGPFAFADDTTWKASLRTTKICEMLLKHPGMGIMVSSRDVKLSTLNIADPIETILPTNLVLESALKSLPFHKDLINDVPALQTLRWDVRESTAISTYHLDRGHNLISVLVDRVGTIDVRIGASLNLNSDRQLHMKIINALQKKRGEALLYAVYNILPPHADDGVELWVTRLDGNNRKSRLALRDILSILEKPIPQN